MSKFSKITKIAFTLISQDHSLNAEQVGERIPKALSKRSPSWRSEAFAEDSKGFDAAAVVQRIQQVAASASDPWERRLASVWLKREES